MTYINQVVIKDTGGNTLDIESNGAAAVNIQDQHSEAFVLYLYRLDETTAVATQPSVGDNSLVVDSTAGSSVGDAITVFGTGRAFQSIISAIPDGTHYTLASPVDFEFPVDSVVEVGPWNLNLNGAGGDVIASIHPPSGVEWDIYEIRFTMQDGAAMDGIMFGGIAALTKGIVINVENGITKNHAIIVNNTGFYEHGFNIEYDDRAGGSGVYTIRGVKNVHSGNGVSLRISGIADFFKLIIRDDLTGLTQFVMTVAGHIVTD